MNTNDIYNMIYRTEVMVMFSPPLAVVSGVALGSKILFFLVWINFFVINLFLSSSHL
jgi:hypothetical protein